MIKLSLIALQLLQEIGCLVKIIAVGTEANLMQGKTHENIKTIRPLKDGVIADFMLLNK